MARAGGRDPERLGEALETPNGRSCRDRLIPRAASLARPRREGARPRLRRRADRRRRLRRHRHASRLPSAWSSAPRPTPASPGWASWCARRAPSASSSGCRSRCAASTASRRARPSVFVEALRGVLDVPGRELRRALHDRPRRSVTAAARRGRARGRPPPDELSRVVERPPTLRPPVEPPHRGRPRPSQGQILARRLIALGVLVAALIGLALAGYYGVRGVSGKSSKPATTRVLAPPPKPFRIIFPEGFTRAADGRARRRGRPDRGAEAPHEGRALVACVSGGDREAAADPRVRREALRPRGVPVPGHVRLLEADDLGAARRAPAEGVRAQLARGRTSRTRARRT